MKKPGGEAGRVSIRQEAIVSEATNSIPQSPMKLCPECSGRYIPENQARCFAGAQVTPCGDPSCQCARIIEEVAR